MNATTCIEPRDSRSAIFPARDFDLAATLNSGQAFRWNFQDNGWNGVIGNRWVRLRGDEFSVTAQMAEPVADWNWLKNYLQTDLDFHAILSSFPDDEPMRAAKIACRGLRLLRQEPWECLASFILSSTKQIVQIRQIVSLLCERFGEPVSALPEYAPAFAFPTPERLARATEAELRACKMGFRAPYLSGSARAIAGGQFDLERLRALPVEMARAELMKLPGVGRKIADCVLLFAYGFPTAFPVDVWILKALRRLYFPKRRVSPKRLLHFSETHFGPNAGYAQQYLFHYVRVANKFSGSEFKVQGSMNRPRAKNSKIKIQKSQIP
ncbi:MAG TPA: DNA glycosylase [Verrucomicrobiae bacterium]|nr:DNA glycosylase [Verrucomicrobiae bacterium]